MSLPFKSLCWVVPQILPPDRSGNAGWRTNVPAPVRRRSHVFSSLNPFVGLCPSRQERAGHRALLPLIGRPGPGPGLLLWRPTRVARESRPGDGHCGRSPIPDVLTITYASYKVNGLQGCFKNPDFKDFTKAWVYRMFTNWPFSSILSTIV